MFEHRRQSKKYRRHRRSILSTTLKHYRGGAGLGPGPLPPEPTVMDERNDIYNTPDNNTHAPDLMTPPPPTNDTSSIDDLMTPPPSDAPQTDNFMTPQQTNNNTQTPPADLMTPPSASPTNDTSSIDDLMESSSPISDVSMDDKENSINQSPPSPVDNILAEFNSSTPSLSLETPEEPPSTTPAPAPAAATTTPTTIQLNYDEMMNDPEIEPVIKTLIQKLGDYLQKRTNVYPHTRM